MRWPTNIQKLILIFEHRLAHQGHRLQLNLRTLYIIPTGFGGLWLVSTMLLYLLGINSSSNGPLLLAFLCSGLFFLSLFLTQFNLQGLELITDQPSPAFAGTDVNYPLQLRSSCTRHSIKIGFRGCQTKVVPVLYSGTTIIQLPWAPTQRGLHQPGQVKIHAKAPLGLFVFWSYWQPSQPQLIYPKPLYGPVLELWLSKRNGGANVSGTLRGNSTETLQGLSPHRHEEGLQRVAWKHMARGRGWLAKRFESEANIEIHLSLDREVERELALQHLSARIIELSEKNEAFGLSISGMEAIPNGRGRSHREACLRTVALA